MTGEQKLIKRIEDEIADQEANIELCCNNTMGGLCPNCYVRLQNIIPLQRILNTHRKNTAENGKPKCTCGRYGGHSPDCPVSKKKGGNDE